MRSFRNRINCGRKAKVRRSQHRQRTGKRRSTSLDRSDSWKRNCEGRKSDKPQEWQKSAIPASSSLKNSENSAAESGKNLSKRTTFQSNVMSIFQKNVFWVAAARKISVVFISIDPTRKVLCFSTFASENEKQILRFPFAMIRGESEPHPQPKLNLPLTVEVGGVDVQRLAEGGRGGIQNLAVCLRDRAGE